jgi:hypothetical protein
MIIDIGANYVESLRTKLVILKIMRRYFIMEKIRVTKEVRIPNTDIILEKGDLVGIIREGNLGAKFSGFMGGLAGGSRPAKEIFHLFDQGKIDKSAVQNFVKTYGGKSKSAIDLLSSAIWEVEKSEDLHPEVKRFLRGEGWGKEVWDEVFYLLDNKK